MSSPFFIIFNMIILADGPDAAGKSTLFSELSKIEGGSKNTCLHMTYRYPDHMHTYHTAGLRRVIRRWNSCTSAVHFLDRSWLSESVYAKVYRGGSKFGVSGRILQKWINMYAVQTIICSDSPNLIEERHARLKNQRVEMYSSKMGEVAAEYNRIWLGDTSGSKINTYSDLIASKGGLKSLPNCHYYKIGDDIESLNLRLRDSFEQAIRDNFVNYKFGGSSHQAKFLLVGDQVNHRSPWQTGPFMGYSHSSIFLAKALQETGILENDICYYNINDDDEGLHSREVLEMFAGYTIVMGKEALRTYNKYSDIKPEVIPHPSWASRFSNVKDYSKILTQAILNLNKHD